MNTPVLSNEIDCNKFDKLSAKYIECNAKKLKRKSFNEINKSKKKLNKSELTKKIKNLKKVKPFLI